MTQRHTLITGGAGFIGAHLAARLVERGDHVTLVDNFSRGVQDAVIDGLVATGQVSLFAADLREPGALDPLGDDFGRIFHFAALLGVQNVIDRPFDTLRDNVDLVVRMLDVARRQRSLERFVFPSTSEVYVGTQQAFELPIPSPETTPLAVSALDQPRTSYMLSKIYGEALCQHSGVPFTIVRPHNFYGPRMGLSHVVPQLLQRMVGASAGAQLEVFSPDHMRTFCYIDDAIHYLVELSERPAAAGGTFNVGVQEPEMRIRDLAALLKAVVGRHDISLTDGSTTPGSPHRRCPDMTTTIGVTGHRPAVSLEEGVRRTYEWYHTKVFTSGGVSAT